MLERVAIIIIFPASIGFQFIGWGVRGAWRCEFSSCSYQIYPNEIVSMSLYELWASISRWIKYQK